ncbi:MAG TPA: futalosine hydrolase [Phycisphaerales bacterium]|nr:futalosine hydrolase [Phycisphaerales bacterium]
MPSVLSTIAGGKRTLLAVAAYAEAEAVAAAFPPGVPDPAPVWRLLPLSDDVDMVVTAVGKAAAAGGVARVLDPARHGAVLSVGVAGALGPGLRLGDVVLADRCELADDGLLSAAGFEDLERMGFGPFPGMTSGTLPDAGIVTHLRPFAQVSGPVATVSTCSGTNSAALAWAARAYVAEAMEGAAVALVAARVGVPFAELRIISNTTGDRADQRWDLRGALDRLTAVLGRLAAQAPGR